MTCLTKKGDHLFWSASTTNNFLLASVLLETQTQSNSWVLHILKLLTFSVFYREEMSIWCHPLLPPYQTIRSTATTRSIQLLHSSILIIIDPQWVQPLLTLLLFSLKQVLANLPKRLESWVSFVMITLTICSTFTNHLN